MIPIESHPPTLESPYGPGAWSQPDRTHVLIDDTHALMTKTTFEKLCEYSTSVPTGVYPGKMWRRHDGAHALMDGANRVTPEWLFCWYGRTEDPTKCSIHFRKVILV
jgi:hypothetical protein